METPKGYRGPPPRKDLVVSPSRERDWKGNDLFGTADTDMSDERHRVTTPYSESGAAPGLSGDYVDPHLKSHRDYESEYAKLAMQGGHRDLLHMDNHNDDLDNGIKHRGCEENLSEYNRLARQGGHKGILSMNDSDEKQESSRKQKGCENVSEYNRIALQGGHKDLLVIEENKRPSSKVTYARNGGDWFAHNNNDSPPQKVSQKPPPIQTAPTKPAPKPAIQFGALPGGEEQQPRTGKKRFEQQRRDAPFATNW
ncbi:uncharacterized protein LOC130641932 isoform X2 [Hydractinia symbiolongicarpus]|uniref:uncharacterized protein LOC130641932 isoform X2 n=1 Tax=Hydractinia symbiolongicarpus TaxID=13093 RepID=UPI0025506AF8|nr:uncharacterized protein LOC130641932 isoform X2 [Hydractinia symbiolongicarpus]